MRVSCLEMGLRSIKIKIEQPRCGKKRSCRTYGVASGDQLELLHVLTFGGIARHSHTDTVAALKLLLVT
jgi:hypothetical protein